MDNGNQSDQKLASAIKDEIARLQAEMARLKKAAKENRQRNPELEAVTAQMREIDTRLVELNSNLQKCG